jgi:hypothetical protein
VFIGLVLRTTVFAHNVVSPLRRVAYVNNIGTPRGGTIDDRTREQEKLVTHSAVSSKLKQTLFELLAGRRRGGIHGVEKEVVGGGVFASSPSRVRDRVLGYQVVASSTSSRGRG